MELQIGFLEINIRLQMRTRRQIVKTLLRKILKKLRQGSWFPFYYTLWHRTKPDPHTILLESRHGQALESNIYALLKELSKEEYRGYRIVVPAARAHRREYEQKIKNGGLRVDRLVPFGGLSYYHELCRAGFLVNDISFPGRFIKKNGQKMLNVWHGTPLKRMGSVRSWALARQTQRARKTISTRPSKPGMAGRSS